MYFLTGATGKLGRIVLDLLLQDVPANKVRVMARQPDSLAPYARRGVEVVKADFDQPDSLKVALKGVHVALLISGSAVGKRIQQHQAFLEAASRNAVARLVYTSLLRADASKMALAEEHWQTEEAIRRTGIPATILRNGWYFENYTDRLDAIRAQGGIVGCAKDGRVNAASRRDYAEAAAHVLLGKGGVGGTHELAGDKGFTLTELAEEIGRQTKQPCRYTDVDANKLGATLRAADIAPPFADFLVDCDLGIARGDLADETGELHKLIGRATTTLQQAVAAGLAQPHG